MFKKLSLLLAAVAVVAFAAPAIASAAPAVTMPAGTLLPKGTKIKGKSTNFVVNTSLGNLTCESVAFEAELTENTGTQFAGVGVGEGTTSVCKLNGTTSIQFTDFTLVSFTSGIIGTIFTKVTFKVDLPGGIVCHYLSPSGPGLLVSYLTGTAIWRIVAASLLSTPAACGSSESSKMSGEFSMTNT